MYLCSIASGSSGNCILVGTKSTQILIDAGVSARRIEQGLKELQVDPATLAGILITHEHSDHIQSVGTLARKYQLPVFGTVETLSALQRLKSVGKIPEEQLSGVKADTVFALGDIMVEPYSISHDASNPVCYTFCHKEFKIGMATDLGTYTDYTVSKLKDSNVIYIEANHDVNMLMVGKYPYYLKQRILGDFGHLSNERCASLVCELLNDNLSDVVLGHLSKENNYAELAYETIRYEVRQHYGSEKEMPQIKVANRDIISDRIIVKASK